MASNRKQPFGYKVVCGEIALHESEADTVRWIFATFLEGATYGKLVDILQERGIPYDVGKPWNKNMVARILEDRRYIGTDEFPPILKREQFEASQVSKQKRVPPRYQTPAQKELRRLCGCIPPSWVERQITGVLNRLIKKPDMITYKEEAVNELEISALQQQLDDSLHLQPVEEAQIRSIAVQLAEKRLNAISSEEYETRRLQSLFKGREPLTELDQELLHESVQRIAYQNGIVSVTLKNQQVLKGGTTK